MNATTQPETAQPSEDGLRLVLPGKAESAGAGMTWISEGWRLFTRAPLMWIISVVILLVIAIAVNLIPILGGLIFQIVQTVLLGGFVAACRSIEKGGEFELEHLFAGFTRRFGPLAIVGLLLLVGTIVIMLVFAAFVGFSILTAFLAGDPEAVAASIMASMGAILLGTLVMLALFVPLIAAYWFAPALVMMHDMKPVEAMKESFFACFRNFVPFLVYGIVMLVAAIVAMIPFGLGLFLLVPVAIASTYAAYRRIFTEETGAAPAPTVRV